MLLQEEAEATLIPRGLPEPQGRSNVASVHKVTRCGREQKGGVSALGVDPWMASAKASWQGGQHHSGLLGIRRGATMDGLSSEIEAPPEKGLLSVMVPTGSPAIGQVSGT